MRGQWKGGQRGIAIFFTIFTLLLLSAIAAALIFASSTETSVNYNYKSEQTAYFGARAGIEEVRDRLMVSTAPTLANGALLGPPGCTAGVNCKFYLPDPPANSSVLYLLNEGNAPGTVTPWTAGSAFMDDELCHDGYLFPGFVPAPSDVRCTTTPGGANWYVTATSNLPQSGGANPVPFKWVRVSPKLNNSVPNYPVNPAALPTAQVCWDGVSEQTLPACVVSALGPPNAPTCDDWGTTPSPPGCPIGTPPVYASQVFMLTALGSAPSSARKVVQEEVGLAPTPPFPFGMFATSTNCPAVTFTGNGYTDSYNSSIGSYGGSNVGSQGDVGSYGSLSLSGNGTINGMYGAPNVTPGPCPAGGIVETGGATITNGTSVVPPGTYSFPPPAPPNPLPPTSNYNPPSSGAGCTATGASNCMVPGTYGNISLSGQTNLVMAPGTYNINSLSESGQAVISIYPPGAVVLNVAGTGGGSVFNLSGQGISNPPPGTANDFMVNYAGTGNITLSGQGSTTAVIYAPNAQINVSGNGGFFGSVVGSTINFSGNGGFHFDTKSRLRPSSNANYTAISFREASY